MFSRHQANAQSKAHEAGNIVNAEPLLQLRPVRLNRFHADSKREGNFLGAVALSDELESFALPRRELVDRTGRRAFRSSTKQAAPRWSLTGRPLAFVCRRNAHAAQCHIAVTNRLSGKT